MQGRAAFVAQAPGMAAKLKEVYPVAPALSKRSRLLGTAIIGVVGAFAIGAAIGYALNDSDDPSESPAERTLAARPSTGYQSPLDPYARAATQADSDASNGAETAPAQSGGGGWAPYPGASLATDESKMIQPYGLCPAPVGNVFNGSILDLSSAGFAASLLGSGFELTSISVRAEGDCGDDGQADDGELVLDTAWIHTDTGFTLQVSQRANADESANMLFNESAQFWNNGYQFNLYVNAYVYYPLTRESPVVDPATDPRVAQVRDAALAQLAPEIGVQCFFRQEAGDWGDLASLGINDPRGALPAGFTESYSSIYRIVEPDAGCAGADLDPQVSAGFNAGFQLNNGEGWLDIGAWPVYEAVTYPGYIDSYGANWSNGDWQFSVYGNKGGNPLGVETLEAIARALDPSYDSQCFIKERELAEGDLAGLGFNVPVIPDGYAIEKSSLRVSDVEPGCSLDDVAAPNYYLSWTITNGDNVYEVSVSRMAPSAGVEYSNEGWISDYGINWANDNTYFSIWASSRGFTGIPDRDTMIAIAESLDPGVDVSTFTEDGGPKPMPAIAEDASRSSSGSSGSTTP